MIFHHEQNKNAHRGVRNAALCARLIVGLLFQRVTYSKLRRRKVAPRTVNEMQRHLAEKASTVTRVN